MTHARGWILVIDDSPLVRGLLEDGLASTFEFYAASSGEEALALARSTTFDAVLCDLSMPGMTGLEVVTQLKALFPLLPIIMFTESIELQDAVEAMRLGAFGYLSKGIANQAIIDELHKAIAHRKVLERNLQLEADAQTYKRDLIRSQIVEEEALRHSRELEALLEVKTAQIAQLESVRGQDAKRVAMGSLVAGIAHEVNNPLAVLKSGARFLAEALPAAMAGSDPETVRDVSETISELEMAAVRIQSIVHNLKQIAHQSKADASCNPDLVLSAAWSQVRNQTPARIALVLDVDPAANRVGMSQEDLVLIISHLVSNAADAIQTRGERGKVSLRVKTANGLVTLEVEDDGCGIAAGDLAQVCDPFFTTKAPGAGTGLGLSLVSQVVKNARGTLRIASAPGRGTRVEVSVPADAPLRRPQSPAARS